jgi:uncharacterized protein (TIGR03437 family)
MRRTVTGRLESNVKQIRQKIAPLLASALLAPALCLAQAPTYTITTVVGNGATGFSGDAGQATSAQLASPLTLVVDKTGILYIVDQVNHRVRRVGTDGVISTIVGNGTAAYVGDDKAAADAQLNAPCGITMDSSGNLLISDTTNHVVRKVAIGGNITRVAGNNTSGFSGDFVPSTDTTVTNLTGKATDAQLNLPTGIAADASGNIYIADTANNRIRKVNKDGIISTVAGTGTAGFGGDGADATKAKLNHPVGLAVDAAGNLYIADQSNHRVRKLTVATGFISTVAGTGLPGYSGNGGPATSAKLFYPSGVAVDASGRIFIADTTNSRIRAVLENQTMVTVAGTGRFGDSGDEGPAARAEIKFPSGVAVGLNGKIYIADNNNHKIRLLTPDSVPPTVEKPPVISEDGIISSAAFGAFTAAAPGSWVDIIGSNLAKDTAEWSASESAGNRAPTTLEGTTVTVDGQAAPLVYVSGNHLRAQLPTTLATGRRQVTVTTAYGSSQPREITVNAVQPGIFAPSTLRVNDVQFAGALLDDGQTYALPADALEGVPSRPVRVGETLTFTGIGFGAVNPGVEAGETTAEENSLLLPVTVRIGDAEATVQYAGLAPGQIGVYLFKVVVPEIAEAGILPLTITVDGAEISQKLSVAVDKAAAQE